MHPNTRRILDDLKRKGKDVSGLETLLTSDADIDNYIGGGVRRQQEYNQILTEKRQVETQLAAAQTQLQNPNNGLNAQQMAALRTKIEGLENFLRNEGDFTEESVDGLFKEFKPLFAASQNPAPNSTQNPSQTSGQQFVFNEEARRQLQQQATVGGAVLGLGYQMQLQKAYAEYSNLYGRFPSQQEITALETALAERVVQGGENIDTVASDVFNFAGKRQEIANADLQRQLQEAEARGRQTALQEHPELAARIPRARTVAPVARHFQGSSTPGIISNNARVNSSVATRTPENPPPPANIPVNPADPNAALRDEHGRLPFQQRGNAASRVMHLHSVVASRPEIFEADYHPLYNSQPQQ